MHLACLDSHSLRFSTQTSMIPEFQSMPSNTRQNSSASSGPEGDSTSGAATEALARGNCGGGTKPELNQGSGENIWVDSLGQGSG